MDNSRKPNRGQPRRKRKVPPPAEAIDGDDETSIADSDTNNRYVLRFESKHRYFLFWTLLCICFFSPVAPHKQGDLSLPFVTEIYPSDYTEFESFSEPEFTEPEVNHYHYIYYLMLECMHNRVENAS